MLHFDVNVFNCVVSVCKKEQVVQLWILLDGFELSLEISLAVDQLGEIQKKIACWEEPMLRRVIMRNEFFTSDSKGNNRCLPRSDTE